MYFHRRRKNDPLFALRMRVSNLILKQLQAGYTEKSKKTTDLLGCSYETLMEHLGPKPEGNYHLDHIVPCAQAKNAEELIKLQHYTNFRWLPAKENLEKCCSRTPEGEELCRKLLGREWED